MNSILGPRTGRAPLLAWLTGSALTALATYATTAVSQPNAGVPASEGAAPTVTAQWQSYDLRFHYFGFTTYYSCSGLEERLEQLLREMGADRDVRVSASGCFGFHDVNNMLSARIQVRMPVTGGATSGATNGTTNSTTPGASFPAVSKSVELRGSRAGEIGSGDCELLEQVRDQLLPALKLQLIKDNLSCIPGQPSFRRYALQVMALIPEKPAKP